MRILASFMVCFSIMASKKLHKPSVIQNNSVTLSSVNVAIIYSFRTEPKKIKYDLFGHGFVYSVQQRLFRPIGYKL